MMPELPPHFHRKDRFADTAGVPWSGRTLTPSMFPEDHGQTPPALAAAFELFTAGKDPFLRGVVAALAKARMLVPILAIGAETTISAHGLTSDNGADMALVTITRPDGSVVMPLFSSIEALATWNQKARPVPVPAAQAAQAAIAEGCTELLIDPGSLPDPRQERSDQSATEAGPTGLLLQRSILWALAQGRAWMPPHTDPQVHDALAGIAAQIPAVHALVPAPGTEREVTVQASLDPGLTAPQLQEVIAQISAAMAHSELIAERVSSMKLALTSHGEQTGYGERASHGEHA